MVFVVLSVRATMVKGQAWLVGNSERLPFYKTCDRCSESVPDTHIPEGCTGISSLQDNDTLQVPVIPVDGVLWRRVANTITLQDWSRASHFIQVLGKSICQWCYHHHRSKQLPVRVQVHCSLVGQQAVRHEKDNHAISLPRSEQDRNVVSAIPKPFNNAVINHNKMSTPVLCVMGGRLCLPESMRIVLSTVARIHFDFENI